MCESYSEIPPLGGPEEVYGFAWAGAAEKAPCACAECELARAGNVRLNNRAGAEWAGDSSLLLCADASEQLETNLKGLSYV
jgi:hypothetical protein